MRVFFFLVCVQVSDWFSPLFWCWSLVCRWLITTTGQIWLKQLLHGWVWCIVALRLPNLVPRRGTGRQFKQETSCPTIVSVWFTEFWTEEIVVNLDHTTFFVIVNFTRRIYSLVLIRSCDAITASKNFQFNVLLLLILVKWGVWMF